MVWELIICSLQVSNEVMEESVHTLVRHQKHPHPEAEERQEMQGGDGQVVEPREEST